MITNELLSQFSEGSWALRQRAGKTVASGIAMLSATAAADAAIIHFVPSGGNSSPTSTTLSWDMTSDAIGTGYISGWDFAVSNHGDIHTTYGTGAGVVATSTWGTAINLTAGTLIGSSSTFSGDYAYLGGVNGFSGESTGFLGVRFDIGGDIHYGWAELSFSSGTHSVLQWAYEDQAGVSIAAGTVPEPSHAALLLGAGAAGVAAYRRRKKAAAA